MFSLKYLWILCLSCGTRWKISCLSTSINNLDSNHTNQYFKPSSLPSSFPTAPPTSSTPSRSNEPTSRGTSPTSFPTKYIKTDFPTNIPTFIYHSPSTIPTSIPSFPSSSPSSTPSLRPSLRPTSFPTLLSTDEPTSQPTSSPSFAPTLSGILGKDWWFLVSSRVILYSQTKETFSSDDIQLIIDKLNYAFVFEYSEVLSAAETEEITVLVDSIDNYPDSPFLSKALPLRTSSSWSSSSVLHNLDSTTNVSATFILKIWCPVQNIQHLVFERTVYLQGDPEPILSILHEQGFRDISTVELANIQQSITTVPPPADNSNLSPDRIIYIIIGTIVVFTFGAFFIAGCRRFTLQGNESSKIQLQDFDGDVMMTRVSPISSPHRRSSSSSPIQSPMHHPKRKSKIRSPSMQPLSDEDRDRSREEPKEKQSVVKQEDEEVFNFDFSQIHNTDEKKDASSSSSPHQFEDLEGGTIADNYEDDEDEFLPPHGNHNPIHSSSSSFSFFSSFRRDRTNINKKKKRSKDRIDYETLVF